MMENKQLHCCGEHVELALDVAVDEFEGVPVLEKLENQSTCEFCEKQAIYIVRN